MEGQWASKFCYPRSQKLKNIFPALNDVLLIAGVLAAGSIEVSSRSVVRWSSGSGQVSWCNVWSISGLG